MCPQIAGFTEHQYIYIYIYKSKMPQGQDCHMTLLTTSTCNSLITSKFKVILE